MTDPTERHMAEARELLMQLDRYVAVPGTEQAGDDTRLVAQALAQAERRGAEAQRNADVQIARDTKVGDDAQDGRGISWRAACDCCAESIRTAPLAAAAPDPAPAADVRAAVPERLVYDGDVFDELVAYDVDVLHIERMDRDKIFMIAERGGHEVFKAWLTAEKRCHLSLWQEDDGAIKRQTKEPLGRRLVERGGRDE